jgi:MFS family permease
MRAPDTKPPPPLEEEQEFLVNRSRKLRLLIPLIVAFAFLMEQLDSTIVTTAIPDMANSLHVPPLQMNLAITSYILTLAVFIPVSGWIADRFGTRRVFAAALLIFTIASALCGLAESLPMLIATRILQGFGGAMMTPVGRLILLRAFPRSELVTAMTYMSVPAIIGPTIGPLLGGVLTTYANWRWIFYVNVPIGLIGILLALRFVKDLNQTRPPRFDVIGCRCCNSRWRMSAIRSFRVRWCSSSAARLWGCCSRIAPMRPGTPIQRWISVCSRSVASVSARWPAASAAPASTPYRSCCRCCSRSGSA